MKTKPEEARKALADARQEIEELSSRLDAMHEILARKNKILRLLAMGDCTAEELRLSDNE